MTLHTKALAAALGVVAALSLAACNGGGSSVNPFAPSRGTVRFINASPDAGTIDVAVGTANSPNFTGLPYAGTAQNPTTNSNAGISAYTPFNAPTQALFIYKSGTTTQITVPQTTVTITPNGRTTLVLTGSAAKGTLRVATFNEHLFKTIATAGSVAFHHASQAFATTKFTVGAQAATSSTTACSTGFAVIPPQITFGVSPTFQEGVPPAPTGVAFCVQSGSSLLTLLPSQVDASNTGNVMPFTGTGSVNSDQNLSIYAIDGPIGSGKPVLVGVFDPDN
jgi:hypothetical protein